jgi:hypothetical protein
MPTVSNRSWDSDARYRRSCVRHELAPVHRRIRRIDASWSQPEQVRRDAQVAHESAEVTDVVCVCFAAFDTGDLGLAEAAGVPCLTLRFALGKTGESDD